MNRTEPSSLLCLWQCNSASFFMSAYPCQNGVIWSLRKPEDPPQAPMMSVTSNITSRMPASQFQPTWWPWCASAQLTCCEYVNRERVYGRCWRHVRRQNFVSASKWQNLLLKCDHLALTNSYFPVVHWLGSLGAQFDPETVWSYGNYGILYIFVYS